MIKVLVNGAFGRMGSEVVRMVTANPESLPLWTPLHRM